MHQAYNYVLELNACLKRFFNQNLKVQALEQPEYYVSTKP